MYPRFSTDNAASPCFRGCRNPGRSAASLGWPDPVEHGGAIAAARAPPIAAIAAIAAFAAIAAMAAIGGAKQLLAIAAAA
mmetsp:Transcript_39047/g.62922  ORF Transcript_39047/g.62922 Transcript_39047/m.62922 type:complete len:80 (-) Transcript_39047:224-463(-)